MKTAFVVLLILALTAVAAAASPAAYWRFEGKAGDAAVRDAVNGIEAVTEGKTSYSDQVPLAIIPLTGEANHGSMSLNGGWLRAKSCPALNETRALTVEIWVKFASYTASPQVLISKGMHGVGNWHIITQPDGSVRANVYGSTQVFLFDAESGLPIQGVWYHLAATYEDIGQGCTRVKGYVNGQLRGSITGPGLGDTSGADLYIGSDIDGALPFIGSIDEVRITNAVLKPSEFLIAGPRDIPLQNMSTKPVFVKPGTRITPEMRSKANGAPIVAKPAGYPYFHTVMFGSPIRLDPPPKPYTLDFSWALTDAHVNKGGASAGWHFAVRPGANCMVALGLYDPHASQFKREQMVVIDGKDMDTIDVARAEVGKPFIKFYKAKDVNRDGYIQVSCVPTGEEDDHTSIMNMVWLLRGEDSRKIDLAKLARGICDVPPLYYVVCGRDAGIKGHVGYPALSASERSLMLPMRTASSKVSTTLPKPADPIAVEIGGELEQRIDTYLDRWGYLGRDQKAPVNFLSDCGFECVGRYMDTLSKLSRLTQRDFQLKTTLDSFLPKQDGWSKHPGAFVGGKPVRTGFIWSQGTDLNGLMAYYDNTGDKRAIRAALKLCGWYRSYLSNPDLAAANYFVEKGEFSRDGATVGHLCKGGLEGITWVYDRTKDPQVLDLAKRVAELNRQWGGVAWMIHGDLPPDRQQYEGWHIHANLTTVRGFPWLYSATGDRSYLADAIAACDRVYQRATWPTGGVLEQIPWAGTAFPGATPDPHDETCQTSDLLQLSYLLAEFTGDGRFYDRGERIYYNHIRYAQMHNGDFTAMNRIPGQIRGGDAWFCCGFWGAKALYEAGRHLYASTPDSVCVTGYMPSSATLRLASGSVRIVTEADIPKSGAVRLTLHPSAVRRFALKLRVPGWAVFRSVKVNGKAVPASRSLDYIVINRAWKSEDRVELAFDLPLRVEISNPFDGTKPCPVRLGDAEPVDARYITVFKGPVIVAQFRANHGCDLEWAYTGDHPDLFETIDSSADLIETDTWRFAADTAPSNIRVERIGGSVRVEWHYEPQPGWSLKRSAVVHSNVPVTVEFVSDLTTPSAEAARSVKSFQTCGVRMRTRGFADYKSARILVDGKEHAGDARPLRSKIALDNGYVRFTLAPRDTLLSASDCGGCAAVYAAPVSSGNSFKAGTTLTVTGRSSFVAPVYLASTGGSH